MSKCFICPRACGRDRACGNLGFCRAPEELLVAKIMLHKWEEPCISGRGGAGTIFFSGCNLHCIYCQNCAISGGEVGQIMSDGELERQIFSLVEQGVECLEFVTPTHYTDKLATLLEKIKPRLNIPTVWNSGGYESVGSLRLLDGLIDVYLPDFKYFSPEISKNYSAAPDYAEIAIKAFGEMHRQVGNPQFDGNGMLKKGLLVRHLVLPSHRADSIEVLRLLEREIGHGNMLLSLMSQYTPDFYIECGRMGDYKCLCRRVTSFEYDSVAREAQTLGFEGFFQKSSSADRKYTPDFQG